MKLLEFLKDMFGKNDTVYLNEKIADNAATELAVEMFAIHAAINLIAGCIAKCEFKTYLRNKEVKEDQYYLWNVEPNVNQNSTEFIQELIYKLLFNNEVLVIQHNYQFFIADNFYRHEYALVEDYFENVVIKDFKFNKKFKMSDVIYIKLNNKDINGLLHKLILGYNKLLSMAIGKYRRSGGRKGKVDIDETASGNEQKKEKIKKLFEKDFRQYFESENAVINLPRGVDYTEITGEGSKKSTSEMVDIRNLLDEVFTRTAQAFRIPPSLLKGDIANVSELTDNLLTFCIDPFTDILESEINRKQYGKAAYLQGSYLKIDTTCIKHIDVFSIADKIDKLISDGVYSIDEIREKIKDIALGEEWSERHWITKNYQDISDLEGGEKNEE